MIPHAGHPWHPGPSIPHLLTLALLNAFPLHAEPTEPGLQTFLQEAIRPNFENTRGFARQAASACRPIGGMRYRKDGWVALRPTGREGELLTTVLLAGERLAINARTQPGGQVQVEVLDSASRPLPGYSGANAASFAGDSVCAPLSWGRGGQATLPAQPVRLRVQLRQAELFALHWR